MIKLRIPLNITVGKKRKALSMNNYERAHFHILTKLKHQFREFVRLSLLEQKAKPITGRFKIHYQIFFPDKRQRDCKNYLDFIDKLLLDALQKNRGTQADTNNKEYIQNDSWQYYIGGSWNFGGILTTGNEGYVIATIEEEE